MSTNKKCWALWTALDIVSRREVAQLRLRDAKKEENEKRVGRLAAKLRRLQWIERQVAELLSRDESGKEGESELSPEKQEELKTLTTRLTEVRGEYDSAKQSVWESDDELKQIEREIAWLAGRRESLAGSLGVVR